MSALPSVNRHIHIILDNMYDHVRPYLTSPLYMQAAVLNAKGVNPEGKVRPSVLALSRQGMPNLPGTSKEAVLKGGYIVHGGDAKPDVIFIATGARLHCGIALWHCIVALHCGITLQCLWPVPLVGCELCGRFLICHTTQGSDRLPQGPNLSLCHPSAFLGKHMTNIFAPVGALTLSCGLSS